jgi:hypothetical protein
MRRNPGSCTRQTAQAYADQHLRSLFPGRFIAAFSLGGLLAICGATRLSLAANALFVQAKPSLPDIVCSAKRLDGLDVS